MLRKNLFGFTLAELLIAMAILGEIATFTIPKILSSQQNGSYNAAAKEAAATLTNAFQQYRLDNTVTSSTTPGALTQYMNYVSVESGTTVDWEYGSSGSATCASGTIKCLRLHSGAILLYTADNFAGTNSTNALFFYFDPNGKADGTTNAPGKSIVFWLYANGAITNWGNARANTVNQFGTYNPALTETHSSLTLWQLH